MTTLPRLPFRRAWTRALRRELGPSAADEILRRADEHFPAVLARRPTYTTLDRGQRFHFERSAAPTIAMYRALQDAGYDDARDIMLALFRHRIRPLEVATGAFARLPLPWAALQRVIRTVVPRAFPAPGWRWQIADDDGTLACTAVACLYHRIYTDYGVGELTPIACAGDDILFARLPGGATMARTGTLGRGSSCCDFRFHRAPPGLRQGPAGLAC